MSGRPQRCGALAKSIPCTPALNRGARALNNRTMRCALAVVACLAGAAHAAPDSQQAEAHALFVEGSKHYNLREYREAIEAFKHAYALFPEPTFLFNIGQAYRQLNDCENARVFYRNYVRAAPSGADRANAEQLAGEMETCAAEQKRAPVAIAAPAAPSRYGGLRFGGIVIAGVGAALAGAGIVFSLEASAAARQLERRCTPGCNAADVVSLDSEGKTWSQLSIAMYAVGGAAVVAGGIMVLWASLHADAPPVAVVPIPGGAAVSAAFQL